PTHTSSLSLHDALPISTKFFLQNHPVEWRALMELLVSGTAAYLRAQVDAGAQALQVFDSWAGALSPRDYDTSVSPFTRRLFDEIDRKSTRLNSSHGSSS